MKLIIAGSRHFKFDLTAIQNFIDNLIPENIMVTEVVCGMAKGVDISGKNWADFHHIPVKKFPADWDKHGPAAGPMRNKEMAQYATALLLVWDGKSRGSYNMKSYAQKFNLPIYEVILNVAT